MKFAYICALLIISTLTLVSHFGLNAIIKQQYGAADLLQKSEEQRMLSQQIASFATQYALGDQSMQSNILEASNAFETRHQELINAALSEQAQSPQEKAIRHIYVDGRHSLNNMANEFLSRARYITTLETDSIWLRGKVISLATFSNTGIINALNKVEALHKEISISKINTLSLYEKISIISILITVLATGLGIFRPIVNRIETYVQQLEFMATTDQLTGLYNFRKFHDSAAIELDRAKRQNLKTCAIMLDLDHFKSINDTYGHQGGDKVLKAVSKIMKECLRPSDIIGRVGGEEFAIILVDTNMHDAQHIAERLRHSINMLNVEVGKHMISTISASIGLARFAANETQIEATLKLADDALYQAKNDGRNRVIIAQGNKMIGKAPSSETPEDDTLNALARLVHNKNALKRVKI